MLPNYLFRLALCLVVGFGLLGSGMAAPDFSGTWVRDKAKSDPLGTIGRQEGGQRPDIEVTLTVKQEAKKLQVVTKRADRGTSETNYTLDGNQHTYWRGGRLTYRSKWDMDKLLIEKTGIYSGNRGDMEFKSNEEWSLSDDGKVLTVTTTYSGQQAKRIMKQVYKRQ